MTTNILQLDIKDENLKEIFHKNPFFIDVKGSINICQVRCGQTFENNNVKLSSMTNFGKLLVLNPNQKDKVTAKIKLAFDSANDDLDENGDAFYELKNIFFSVPSFHRINGELSDLESYVVYASPQTNGSVLYSVICTMYNGTPTLPTENHELLSYKLLDELFGVSNDNNIIPEKFGTKAIVTPDNLDINELLPEKGSQSFYEYVNPINPNVNVRIFQKKLNVSNSCLEKLRTKLTPGVEYNNFKLAVSQQINPPKGLFFFYSQDLTNNYKNYIASQKPTSDTGDSIREFIKSKEVDEIEHISEEETQEEEMVLIQKLRKVHFDKKEKYLNFDDSLNSKDKIYQINSTNGRIETFEGDKNKPKIYDNLHDLMIKNPKLDIDEIKKAIEQFPNYTYQGSCWRYNYTIVLYKVKGEGFDIDKEKIPEEDIEHQTIQQAAKKIGLEDNLESQQEVFYAMKNFPNYEKNEYYITYFYNMNDTESRFKLIIGIVIFWTILLINYLFYRVVFNAAGNDYGSLMVDKNDILINDEMKNLACNRLLINGVFIIQIILTIIYSLLCIGGLIKGETTITWIISIFIILFLFLLGCYIPKRFSFDSKQVSYVEDNSLHLFLEAESNDSSFWKVWDLIKSFTMVFYPQKQSEIQEILKNIYDKMDSIENEDVKTTLSSDLQRLISSNSTDPQSLNNSLKNINSLPENMKVNINKLGKLLQQKGGADPAQPILFSTTSQPPAPILFSATEEVPLVLKTNNETNVNNNVDTVNTIFNGKPYFPDLNSNETTGNKKKGPFEKVPWTSNLINKILEPVKLFVIIGFITFILVIMYNLGDLYNTYNLGKNIINAGSLLYFNNFWVLLIIYFAYSYSIISKILNYFQVPLPPRLILLLSVSNAVIKVLMSLFKNFTQKYYYIYIILIGLEILIPITFILWKRYFKSESSIQLNLDPALRIPSADSENPALRIPSADSENPALRIPSAEPENPALRIPSAEPENPALRIPSAEPENPALRIPSAEPENPALKVPFNPVNHLEGLIKELNEKLSALAKNDGVLSKRTEAQNELISFFDKIKGLINLLPNTNQGELIKKINNLPKKLNFLKKN